MNKERLVGIIMSVFVSTAMGAVSAALVIHTNPDATKAHSVGMIYASNILLSVVLGMIIAIFLPLGKLGASLARKAKATPPSFKFILLNAIPNSIGNTLIISMVLSFVGVLTARLKLPEETLSKLPPFVIMWLVNWAKLILPTLVISYVLSIILAPIIARLVGFNGPQKGQGPKK